MIALVMCQLVSIFSGLCPGGMSATFGRGAFFDARNSRSCRFWRARFGIIQMVPLVDFPRDIEVKPGALVEFSVGPDDLATRQVLEVNDGQVKVDSNHPMIGKNLRFEIQMLVVIGRCG